MDRKLRSDEIGRSFDPTHYPPILTPQEAVGHEASLKGERSVQDHREMLGRLRESDGQAARQLLRAHLLPTADRG
ncbi:hypothetical protein ACERK3_00065 [Phycisphaerales bacterium AB-hyl4]|uniref:FCD domain-containing protein n=1 Tax=Natronomicrosphaera hydrolytica TaxID=3242702 RepID=A0ABV4TZB0_9BACT